MLHSCSGPARVIRVGLGSSAEVWVVLRMRPFSGCARASCHFPAFRERVGPVTSGRLIRKRRRRQKLPNRGAVVGGGHKALQSKGRDPEAEAHLALGSGEWPLLGRSPGWAAA